MWQRPTISIPSGARGANTCRPARRPWETKVGLPDKVWVFHYGPSRWRLLGFACREPDWGSMGPWAIKLRLKGARTAGKSELLGDITGRGGEKPLRTRPCYAG